MKNQNQNDFHIPVLLRETLQLLSPKAGESYLDLTGGAGGHAAVVIEATGAPKKATIVDRDAQAIKTLQTRFAGADIRHSDFYAASQELAKTDIKFDMILADLGASSLHFDDPDRGFSFGKAGPLDMRMDVRQELDAMKIVNDWPEAELVRILRDYGEEPKAQAIAKKIVVSRPVRTTEQLAAITASRWPRHRRVHPATKTFQALRIAVNDELNQLQESLPIWLELLDNGGRLAVISFHSLEDRIVKDFFRENATDTYDCNYRQLTKKPITASPAETDLNPRARSAKLRAVAKIKRKD